MILKIFGLGVSKLIPGRKLLKISLKSVTLGACPKCRGVEIDKEELLVKLNAQGRQTISSEDMAEAIRRIDPTLNLHYAVYMAICVENIYFLFSLNQ